MHFFCVYPNISCFCLPVIYPATTYIQNYSDFLLLLFGFKNTTHLLSQGLDAAFPYFLLLEILCTIQAFALSEVVLYHPIVWYWKQYGMGPYLWVSSIGFLLRTSFCNTTPLQITCFCVKGYTLVRVHRVTVLSGIGVHSRQRGGDLRKCLKANSLPQIGWHLECWEAATACWGSFLSSALLPPSLWFPLTKAVWVSSALFLTHDFPFTFDILFFCSLVSSGGCLFCGYIPPDFPTWLLVHSKTSGSLYSVNRNVHSKTLSAHSTYNVATKLYKDIGSRECRLTFGGLVLHQKCTQCCSSQCPVVQCGKRSKRSTMRPQIPPPKAAALTFCFPVLLEKRQIVSIFTCSSALTANILVVGRWISPGYVVMVAQYRGAASHKYKYKYK